MADLETVSYAIEDQFHVVYDVYPDDHFAKIWNSCPEWESPNCTLNITTVTQALYDTFTGFDTGFFYASASELRAKLISRQSVYVHAGDANANFTQLDGGSLCAYINNLAVQWAYSNAGSAATDRYNTIGEPYVMGPDEDTPFDAGPLWVFTALKYTQNDTSGVPEVEVQSACLRTPVNFFVAPVAGFHYCKLLSPARAMEWLYIDSLRLRGSLNSTTIY